MDYEQRGAFATFCLMIATVSGMSLSQSTSIVWDFRQYLIE